MLEDPKQYFNIARSQVFFFFFISFIFITPFFKIERIMLNDILSFQNENRRRSSSSKKGLPSCKALLTFHFSKFKFLAERKGCSNLIECYAKILAYEKENTPSMRFIIAKNIFEG